MASRGENEMATTRPETGINRTGVGMSPRLTEEMVIATEEFEANPLGDESFIANVRSEIARQVDPMGSVPPPPTLKGVAKSVAQKLKAANPEMLIDKLGERLAFERSGVRLYEALLSKLDVAGGFEGGPDRDALLHILQEEFEHFRALEDALEHLGADPTVVTPSANLHLTMTSGIAKAILDPRTSFAQCLEAALVLELADNESWDALREMANEAGDKKLLTLCEEAVSQERDHLIKVRTWVANAQDRPA
jgi:rubrerythrin